MEEQLAQQIPLRTVERLAWAAGFFDGEGCVTIGHCHYKTTRKDGTSREYNNFHLCAQVSQKTREPLDVMSSLFGETIKSKKSHGSVYYHWELHNLKARLFLETLLPFFVVKGQVAVNGIEFHKAQQATRPPGTKPRLPKHLDELRVFYERGKQLNQRNSVKDYTAVETTSPEQVM